MKTIKGDLLKEFKKRTVGVILHVANCQRVFGSGIALQIKEQYPDAYKAYMNHPTINDDVRSEVELGTISYHQFPNDAYIFNLHAQHLYGRSSRYLNYEAFYLTLEKVRDVLAGKGLIDISSINIGVPKNIGSCRAGGNAKIIEKMIEVVFEDVGFQVIIVEFDDWCLADGVE